MVDFYEPRTTAFSSDSDAAFRCDELKVTTMLGEALST